ncbi:hypothetical protein [Knoellia sinensis]|nr:hypothetical protein [Knoellia sinensis]
MADGFRVWGRKSSKSAPKDDFSAFLRPDLPWADESTAPDAPDAADPQPTSADAHTPDIDATRPRASLPAPPPLPPSVVTTEPVVTPEAPFASDPAAALALVTSALRHLAPDAAPEPHLTESEPRVPQTPAAEPVSTPEPQVTPPEEPLAAAVPEVEVEPLPAPVAPPAEPHPAPQVTPPPTQPTPPTPAPAPERTEGHMTLDESIQQLLDIDGATGVAIIDSESGMALAQGGNPGFDLGVAAAGSSNVVRAQVATMKEIGATEAIDDIMITLANQYHLINVLNTPTTEGLFIYLVLDRVGANLALARFRLASVAKTISI